MFTPVFPFQTADDVLACLEKGGLDSKDRISHSLVLVFAGEKDNCLWLLSIFINRALRQCGTDFSSLLLQDTFYKRGAVFLTKSLLGSDFWTGALGAVVDEICSFDLAVAENSEVLGGYCSRVLEAMRATSCSPCGKALAHLQPASIGCRFLFTVVNSFLLQNVASVAPKRVALSHNARRAFVGMAKMLQAVAASVPEKADPEAWSWGSQSIQAIVVLAEVGLAVARTSMRMTSTVASVGSNDEWGAVLGVTRNEAETMRFANKGETHLRELCARLGARHAVSLRRMFVVLEEEREFLAWCVADCLIGVGQGSLSHHNAVAWAVLEMAPGTLAPLAKQLQRNGGPVMDAVLDLLASKMG
jgi:hypothetical protein